MSASAESRVVVCLDADVLIYAASPRHPVGARVKQLIDDPQGFHLCGSVALLPEVLTRPTARGELAEAGRLESFLARIDLWPVTEGVGRLAVWLGANHRLDPMDSVHLATAIDGGADVFLTNNRKDFDAKAIGAIDVIFPDELEPPTRRGRGRGGR